MSLAFQSWVADLQLVFRSLRRTDLISNEDVHKLILVKVIQQLNV